MALSAVHIMLPTRFEELRRDEQLDETAADMLKRVYI